VKPRFTDGRSFVEVTKAEMEKKGYQAKEERGMERFRGEREGDRFRDRREGLDPRRDSRD
jgi:hypothetical protein